MAAIMLEHRKFRDPMTMIEPEKYQASLLPGSPVHLTQGRMWRWVAHGFGHGFLITLFCLHFFEGGTETSGEITILKQVGLKDQSTLAFNIVLHVIFMKLGFELNSLSLCSSNLIVSTIVFNYVLISLFSGQSIGSMVEDELAHVA